MVLLATTELQCPTTYSYNVQPGVYQGDDSEQILVFFLCFLPRMKDVKASQASPGGRPRELEIRGLSLGLPDCLRKEAKTFTLLPEKHSSGLRAQRMGNKS